MSGIYIHFPFCKQKCIYCNFYSVASQRQREAYWDALCREMEIRRNFLPAQPIDTLYIGGGTPSLCTPQELEKMLNSLSRFYTFSKDWEFTLEANPEQLTPDYLSSLKLLGINRLSIGVQSFDDRILQLLNRRHTAKEAKEAVLRAAQVGFENLSIDLIYDIAYRTGEQWREELCTALSLPIVHLSAYSLTVEENTLLAKRVARGERYIPEESDTERDYAILEEMTEKAGFEQYEISNFARNRLVSRHNSAYWSGQPYLGLGAAAHSFLRPVRQWNIADISQYIEGILRGNPAVEREELSMDQQYDEMVLLRLRTREGLLLEEVERCFGEEKVRYLRRQLSKVSPTHYELREGRITLTYSGRLFADAVSAELMWA
ncbi:MAG: radical SAM family heme chaperone HemW [Bacteroidales bacterium]|nr:radical SAM family heme chaperone HemW [Bacteroidales bacterium]